MQLWTVFLTGLLAGGASCAAVQGGLLTGLVARRGLAAPTLTPAFGKPARAPGGHRSPAAKASPAAGRSARSAAPPVAARREWRADAAPVTAFLIGKLASHIMLGAMLGLLGDAVQLGFRTRAVTQGVAGVVMVLLALHLLGIRQLRFLVPQPPAAIGRLVRHSARSQAMAAPIVLGLLTAFIPCGVTLGVAFLAIASGSPLAGALIMAAFVLGTFPLFAVLGYAAVRWATAFGGAIGKVTAVVVLAVGLYTLNGGLTLGGSPVTAGTLTSALAGGDAPAVVPPSAAPFVGPPVPGSAVTSQRFEIEVLNTDYRTPDTVRAGVPTVVTLVTNGTRGCTRGFVIPSLGIEKFLPAKGRTQVELGVLKPGRLEFTCSMGMYGGTIDVVQA